MEAIGFSMCAIMSSANSDRFAFSFPVWIPFISFSCLISVARTSNTMLNRSVESGHPCFFPDFMRKAFSVLPLSVMLAVGFSYMTFIVLSYVPSSPTLLSIFIIN